MLGFAIDYPHVGAKEFVDATGQEVTAEGFDIDRPVGCVVDRIDKRERPRLTREFDDTSNIVDRPDRV